MGTRLSRFSEVVGDREDVLAPPVSSDVSSEGDTSADREGDFAKRLKAIEEKLAAFELRFGGLPGTAAKTSEQFASKISGRRTESQLRESKNFARKITQKGAR